MFLFFSWISIAFLIFVFSSVSGTLPSGQLSAIPWRRSSVKYTNNEAYFDVIEEVDASMCLVWFLFFIRNIFNIISNVFFRFSFLVIDKSGQTVFAEIQGYVRIWSFLIWIYWISWMIFFIQPSDRLLHKIIRNARSDAIIYESTAIRWRFISSMRTIQAMGIGANAIICAARR